MERYERAVINFEIDCGREIEARAYQARQDMFGGVRLHTNVVPGHSRGLIVRSSRRLSSADGKCWPIVKEERVKVIVVNRHDNIWLRGLEMVANFRKITHRLRILAVELRVGDKAWCVWDGIYCNKFSHCLHSPLSCDQVSGH